ncbi:PEPxxWA-CTERM sorting domain-containing protein [Polymorphobacter sp.]|uniref:PEPxxWA-CTERM sorting domain-containing protein n=1 Tax=Polymorphobacter sp. TaxID=1909290 RepID=UPI003F6F66DB
MRAVFTTIGLATLAWATPAAAVRFDVAVVGTLVQLPGAPTTPLPFGTGSGFVASWTIDMSADPFGTALVTPGAGVGAGRRYDGVVSNGTIGIQIGDSGAFLAQLPSSTGSLFVYDNVQAGPALTAARLDQITYNDSASYGAAGVQTVYSHFDTLPADLFLSSIAFGRTATIPVTAQNPHPAAPTLITSVSEADPFLLWQPTTPPTPYVVSLVFRQGSATTPQAANALPTYRFSVSNPLVFLTEVSEVPEPGSWAMLIAGFGLIGAAARRQRSRMAAAT